MTMVNVLALVFTSAVDLLLAYANDHSQVNVRGSIIATSLIFAEEYLINTRDFWAINNTSTLPKSDDLQL